MVKIAVLGHGVVGSGVMQVMMQNKESIARRAGDEISVKYILDLREFDGLPYSDLFVKDYNIILNDPEVKIVVEVLGGLHPAYDFSKAALLHGKSVVTSNKEVVAEKGGELLNLARKNNLNYLFEASVGGGIPIIRPISQCLAANEIYQISGILNGTTNYILTRMFKNGVPFNDALYEAQKLGYAERNPSADVDGIDTCRKICILASLAFGRHIYPETVYTQGISSITADDVALAEKTGSVIKLLGVAKKLKNGKISIMTAPFVVKNTSPLSNVDDVFNGIVVSGNATGDVMFYGRGAGKMPTASACVADIIDEVKHLNARKYLCWAETDTREMNTIIEDINEQGFSYMLRFEDQNVKAECFNEIKGLESVAENGAITPFVKESEMKALLEKFKNRVACYRISE